MKSIVLLIIITFSVSAQSVYKEGNLVRIDFGQREISLADTFLTWYRMNDEFSQKSLEYKSAVTCCGNNYLVSSFSYSSDDITFLNESHYSLYREDGSISFNISGNYANADVIGPYTFFYPTQLKTENGVWFLMGEFGSCFLSKDDTAYEFQQTYDSENPPIFISGKVDSLYLVSYFDEEYNLDCRLHKLNNIPEFDSTNAPRITISPFNTPLHIARIVDDIYLMDTGGDINGFESGHLGIYKRDSLKFTLVRILRDDFFPQLDYRWRYKDDHLYMRDGIYIKQYDFSYADTNFVFQQNVFEAPQGTALSYDWKFAARIDGDSLYVMNTFENDTVNVLDISRITSPSRLIIDSPYVYIHQLKKVTDVKENDEAIVNEFSLSSYPNPFNAVTTITYSVPEAEQVEIKIYDVLGREVITLKNEIEDAGKHQVTWDANNTSSGIYICTMKTERKLMSTKLLLMK